MSTTSLLDPLAARKARARLLGVSLEELIVIDNRTIAITAAAREHGLSFADATTYIDDMEKAAREQAEFERVADDRQREEDEAEECREIEERALRHE
jgi:hypothetical protein